MYHDNCNHGNRTSHYRNDESLGSGDVAEAFLQLVDRAPGGGHLLRDDIRVVGSHWRVEPLLQPVRPLHPNLVQFQEWSEPVGHLKTPLIGVETCYDFFFVGMGQTYNEHTSGNMQT